MTMEKAQQIVERREQARQTVNKITAAILPLIPDPKIRAVAPLAVDKLFVVAVAASEGHHRANLKALNQVPGGKQAYQAALGITTKVASAIGNKPQGKS